MRNQIDLNDIDFAELELVLKQGAKICLTKQAEEKIELCRAYLEKKITESKHPIYGINTGFGSLCKIKISNDQLEDLQLNLVRSHACGLGEEVPEEIVRLIIYLKIRSLSYGHSGVKLATVQRLIDFFNLFLLPIIYEQGSLGASGDLAPLAHLSLPIIGEGEIRIKGTKHNGADLEKLFKLKPLKLGAKEGLALLNGTQFMCAYGVFILLKARKLFDKINLIASLSLDAFDGRIDAFDDKIHRSRPQKGQLDVATQIRVLLKGSEIANKSKEHVQDPYSFRCIPQVHGASLDAIRFAEYVFLTEVNSVTDNPIIFPDEDEILSGGNFHGQPLALALDFLSIALAELGSISERRTYLLIAGLRGLPEFLVANPGLNSGMMIAQYTAASIVSQNKQLCTPASVDSIVSSNGQEDHVSMGANAAVKCLKVLENLEKIVAIELMAAAQALDFRRPLKSASAIESLIESYRKVSPHLSEDRVLNIDIKNTIDFLEKYQLK